jgi:hypothetical protein
LTPPFEGLADLESEIIAEAVTASRDYSLADIRVARSGYLDNSKPTLELQLSSLPYGARTRSLRLRQN